METFEIQIKESKIVDNLFYEYYNHTSKTNYICNKNTFNTPCSICLEKLDYNEKREFRCGHMFHKECIDKWFKKTLSLKCPYCKQII
jgi:hypothetical protein